METQTKVKRALQIVAAAFVLALLFGIIVKALTPSQLDHVNYMIEAESKNNSLLEIELQEVQQRKTISDQKLTDLDTLKKTILAEKNLTEQPSEESGGEVKSHDANAGNFDLVGDKPTPSQTLPEFDIDKLAYAVSIAETQNCTLGYGKEYNNCFGIKNGSISPCKKIGRNRMCIYETTEQSFEAFKKIWSEGYGLRNPTWKDAQVWTGNDRPENWINNVTKSL